MSVTASDAKNYKRSSTRIVKFKSIDLPTFLETVNNAKMPFITFAGFLEQLVELDNDLRRHRELGMPRKLILSTLEDRDSLPNPWNFEFWFVPTSSRNTNYNEMSELFHCQKNN